VRQSNGSEAYKSTSGGLGRGRWGGKRGGGVNPAGAGGDGLAVTTRSRTACVNLLEAYTNLNIRSKANPFDIVQPRLQGLSSDIDCWQRHDFVGYRISSRVSDTNSCRVGVSC